MYLWVVAGVPWQQTSNLAPISQYYQEQKNTSFLRSCRLFWTGFPPPGSKRKGRKCFFYFAVARLEVYQATSVNFVKMAIYQVFIGRAQGTLVTDVNFVKMVIYCVSIGCTQVIITTYLIIYSLHRSTLATDNICIQTI